MSSTGVQAAHRQGEIYGKAVVFAPTATDILAQTWAASLHKIAAIHGGGYTVHYRNPALHGSQTMETTKHETAIGAAVEAWFNCGPGL